MKNKGQINFEEGGLGESIVKMVRSPDIHTIFEIGTWNGLGSTRCVIEGVKDKTDYLFISVECWKDMYNLAVENNKEFLSEKFRIINGKIIDEKEMINSFSINELTAEQRGWLRQDIDRMSEVEIVLSLVPDSIDLLILDGGEFSTYKEWSILKNRTKFVIADDTKTFKCRKIREEITSNKDYEILEDVLDKRNGFIIAKLKA